MTEPRRDTTSADTFSLDDLKQLLEGDVTLVERALALPTDELVALWRQLGGFVLRAEHVRYVLEELRGGSITRDQANRWGSFILLDGGQWLPVETPDWVRTDEDMQQFVIEHSGQRPEEEPVKLLDIPYEPAFEEQIIEAIGMLDNVADIDFSGENIDDELDRLIADLR